MTHICVGKLTIIGSDNGLSPERRQAIIWTNAGILLIGPLGTNFSEILIEIQTFSLKKIRLKMSSAKCCSFRLGLNVKHPMPRWQVWAFGGNVGTGPHCILLAIVFFLCVCVWLCSWIVYEQSFAETIAINHHRFSHQNIGHVFEEIVQGQSVLNILWTDPKRHIRLIRRSRKRWKSNKDTIFGRLKRAAKYF